MSLFTEKEQELIIKEFCYSGRAKRNRLEESREETSIFTEHNLETSINELTRNISSKSIILAPFNSTKSQLSSLHTSVEDIIADIKILKFGTKVREINRQYERNNNCELDNGVYNKCNQSSEQTDENEKPKNLNPFESLESGYLDSFEVGISPQSDLFSQKKTSKSSNHNSSLELKNKISNPTPRHKNSSSKFLLSDTPNLIIGIYYKYIYIYI